MTFIGETILECQTSAMISYDQLYQLMLQIDHPLQYANMIHHHPRIHFEPHGWWSSWVLENVINLFLVCATGVSYQLLPQTLTMTMTNLRAQASATTGSSIKHCRMGQQYFLSSTSEFLRRSWGIPAECQT